jgi:acyl-CoA synthetase (AMP-forming)/AMP-acid ligase II
MTSPVLDAGDDLPLTLPGAWRRHVERRPGEILLANEAVQLSYAEAERRSRRLARGLLAAGAIKGAHVALLYPNGPQFIVGLLAAARIGAVVVPLSTFSTADELRWLLRHSDTTFVLATSEFRGQRFGEVLQAAIPELDLDRPAPVRSLTAPSLRGVWIGDAAIAALEALGESVDDARLDAVEARVMPADPLAIIHTSGSTAQPKGVVHGHGALVRHMDNINQIRGFAPGDALYSTPPWFWIAGFAFTLVGALVAGARIVDSNSISPGEILDLLERERPALTNGFMSSVARLVADPSFEARDLSFIRRGNLHTIFAAELRPRDVELRHGSYGMTEVGGALAMSGDSGDQPEHRRGAFGTILPGFEIRLRDPETGEDAACGDVGELCIRGPFMMEGYYGRPRSEVFDAAGWWRSGDLGRFDAEGFYYFKGRMGDMIKTSGANVAPREVESVLRQLTGRDGFVFGLPDAQRGEVVAAVVVADAGSGLEEADLRSRLREKLSAYKTPRRILTFDPAEIPLLSSGKVNMPRLKALVLERWDASSG